MNEGSTACTGEVRLKMKDGFDQNARIVIGSDDAGIEVGCYCHHFMGRWYCS
jgi:hypothetical protein